MHYVNQKEIARHGHDLVVEFVVSSHLSSNGFSSVFLPLHKVSNPNFTRSVRTHLKRVQDLFAAPWVTNDICVHVFLRSVFPDEKYAMCFIFLG